MFSKCAFIRVEKLEKVNGNLVKRNDDLLSDAVEQANLECLWQFDEEHYKKEEEKVKTILVNWMYKCTICHESSTEPIKKKSE